MPDALKSLDTVEVFEMPPELTANQGPREIRLEADVVRPASLARPRRNSSQDDEPYLILGFDTEFKTPEHHVDRCEIVTGQAKYKVLSYQFHAKTSDGREWKGICCPDGDKRMTLGEFIVFALGKGTSDHGFKDLPSKIYLVGHFTRADVPAFADFKSLTALLSNVRNTFISIDNTTSLVIQHSSGKETTLQVLLRDTMLLTPQASKSLKELGKLVGQDKLELDADPKKHKEMIRNMDRVRTEHWPIFKEYALNDATICVKYIEKVIDQFREVTGSRKVPVTLTSIGVEMLMNSWRDKSKLNPLQVLGKEEIEERHFDKKKGYYIKKKRVVDLEAVHWKLDFVTSCYHGGRNEQFWFGPGFEDEWTDYDLSSAYPTAMSLIGLPKWSEMRHDTEVDHYTATTLGFACVEFEFPPETRFPTLPVRTEHGLIFPLSGTSCCAAPEIAVAKRLGAKMTIKEGVIVPTDSSVRIFGDFIKECLDHRRNAQSKLQGLFWKEISNSTYGKTAQGLRPKRVFDMRDSSTKELPPSRITNPFFAAYITSFTRGILGEVINSLPSEVCVFSCTTDGFLTNARESDLDAAKGGELWNLFANTRQEMTGNATVLEKKHEILQPLGWRTRGQATLIPGSSTVKDASYNVVLAKGGIFTPEEFEGVEDQNDEILRMFFSRSPTSLIRVEGLTGVRDMVTHDADLVQKATYKRLSMEFDWKRRPHGVGTSKLLKHVVFSTKPWDHVDQFDAVRDAWGRATRRNRRSASSKGTTSRHSESTWRSKTSWKAMSRST